LVLELPKQPAVVSNEEIGTGLDCQAGGKDITDIQLPEAVLLLQAVDAQHFQGQAVVEQVLP